MRKIHGALTKELSLHTTIKTVASDPGYKINSFRELVEHVANLAHKNKDHLLFYRGQKADYLNKAGSSTFYPTIYRGDPLTKPELEYRFDLLESASKMLCHQFKSRKLDGYEELVRKKYVQWSILQHYGVTGTPLSDVTQSLRVACSFAHLGNKSDNAFIYVFGLPYYTNRISINSEHDLVNMRLLSITPPSALRPYFQEGFLIGTEDITTEYLTKNELDLNQRIIAKFEIPSTKRFWGDGFDGIPESALYPDGDELKIICDRIKEDLTTALVGSGGIGRFLKEWNKIEALVISRSKEYIENTFSLRNAIVVLMKYEENHYSAYKEFDSLRRFRNKLVHTPDSISDTELRNQLEILNRLKNTIVL